MIYRNGLLLAAVRRLDCVHCQKNGCTQAAHSNQLRFGKGRGIKGSDAAIMALCSDDYSKVGCHAKLDQGSQMNKQERYLFEYEHIALTLIALIEQGYLVIDKDRLK